MVSDLNWRTLALGVAMLTAGCASYDGSGLVAGKSTAAEVEALMGRPAETLQEAGGDTVWFYPRDWGRHTYAVRLGPDRVVRAVEQRLTRQNMTQIAANTSSMKDVRAVFGPPLREARMPRQQRVVWEYRTRDYEELRVMWVQFSDDGVVRELIEMRDLDYDPPLQPTRN